MTTNPAPGRAWWLKVTVAVAAFVLALCALAVGVDHARSRYIGRAFRLPAVSMAPTLLAGDYVLTGLLVEPPVRRGEIVLFHWPEDTTRLFVKRVVGLPGDTLAMRDGVLEVNGRPQRESYVIRDTLPDVGGDELRWQRKHLVDGVRQAGTYHPTRDNWGPLVVPGRSYFVLGDNRDNSLDSRYWGFVREAHLFARPWRIYFSRDPETGDVRWARIGRAVRSGGS